MLKTCTGSKNAKHPNLEAPKPAQAQKNAKNAYTFLHFLHLFEPVQVLKPSVLKTCTGSKNAKHPNL